ncbi:hypothetical protein [Streptomyces sp. NBC_01235]|uniref:hypothetical protein n=1 Tax=Streptomyces sp. NBC_01235 TaxID=2903788 RepID=UPI002E1178E3|nr:hypothetical protein OG289_25100 [Streptomyces sp. NBC_01235]
MGQFKQLHREVGQLVAELINKAISEQHDYMADPEIPLLTRSGWIPNQPLQLSEVCLSYQAPRNETFADAKEQLSTYWPKIPGKRLATYSSAVREFSPPTLFFDAPSFRLIDVDPVAPDEQNCSTFLRFTMGTYFDWYDTGEALGYEAARRYAESHGDKISGPYREWLAYPFDLTRRCATPGINTLTIVTSRHDSIFYLHRRTGVATARGTVHVVPAGEFQPSGGPPGGQTTGGAGFSLQSTIIREYAEEFLDAEDIVDPTNHPTPIDFSADPSHAAIEKALSSAQRHYLGIGFYPLTLKPEILIVCSFSKPQFNQAFRGMQKETYEGYIEGSGGRRLKDDERLSRTIHSIFDLKKGRPFQGLPFDEETVLGYANDATTLPAARACLTLAWRHREVLGIHTN